MAHSRIGSATALAIFPELCLVGYPPKDLLVKPSFVERNLGFLEHVASTTHGIAAMVGGELVTVHPHDLRRTYARRCYDAGMDILAIQQNLGHADHKTTLKYIGVSDVESRQPPSLYSPPHWADLDGLEVQGTLDSEQEQD